MTDGAATVRVTLPPLLRQVAGGVRTLECEGDSLAAAVADLTTRHPALRLHLYNERGDLRRNVLFLHRGEAIRPNEAMGHRLEAGDEVTITNALAGG